MSKRVVLIVAAVLVLGFLAYVGVNSFNGSYAAVAGIGAADVTASREGNSLLTKIRTVPGVASANFAFASGLIGDRKSTIAVKLRASASLSDVRHVVDLARTQYGHGVGDAAGAVLLVTGPDAPALTLTSFSMSSEHAASDLTAWESLRHSTGSTVSVELASSNRRTLTFASGSGASFDWIPKHYGLLTSLAADGFTWSDPGVCDVGALPDAQMIALISQLSAIVPVVPCNTAKPESGLAVSTGGAFPGVVLGFVKGSEGVPFSAHASQFAQVAAVLLSPKTPNMNVGFFGVSGGKLTVLRFFTGSCASGVVTHPDPTDATSLSILKSRGVDIAKHATLGQCSPKQPLPSVKPTPAG